MTFVNSIPISRHFLGFLLLEEHFAIQFFPITISQVFYNSEKRR